MTRRHHARRPRTGNTRDRSALALLLTIIGLAVMTIIAVPFLMSMRLHQKEGAAHLSRTRARLLADAGRDLALARLQGTVGDLDQTPDVDGMDELFVDVGALETEHPVTFDTWRATGDAAERLEVRVEDEQGKVHVDTASPELLMNLLGTTQLAETLGDDDDRLVVTRPEVLRSAAGLLWVGGELVRYDGVEPDGTVWLAERGVAREEPMFRDPAEHASGSLVRDARGWMIAQDRIVDEGRSLLGYATVRDVMRIAAWGADGGTLGAVEADDLTGHATVWSGREVPWAAGTELTDAPRDVRGFTAIVVADTRAYMPNSIIRVLGRGAPMHVRVQAVVPMLRRVSATIRIGDGGRMQVIASALDSQKVPGWLVVQGDVPADEGDLVELEMRHPVNINTASRRVLHALVLGLSDTPDQALRARLPFTNRMARDRQPRFIDEETADAIAALIIEEGPIGSHEHLAEVLEGSPELEDWQVNLVMHNATGRPVTRSTPESTQILYGATAPFAYRSNDTFTVRTSGAIRAPNGLELARHAYREVVTLGTEGVQTFALHSQVDLHDQMETPLGGGIMSLPVTEGEPDDDPDNPEAGVRAAELEEESDGAQVEHFRGELDGYEISEGWSMGLAGNAMAPEMPAGAFEAWIHPSDSLLDRTHIVDVTGHDEYRNCLKCFYDATTGELVFRIADPTLQRAAADVRHLVSGIELEPGNWHHVRVVWKGTEYGHMALFLDGKPVGRLQYRSEDGEVWTTTLTSDLSSTEAMLAAVADAGDFPPVGVIRIGNEVIEYDGVADGGFNNLVRGARGTEEADHPAGVPVNIHGYDVNITAVTVEIQDKAATIDRIHLGGGVLQDVLPETLPQTIMQGNGGDPPGITADDDSVAVADSSEFPDSGFVAIGSEVVWYGSKDGKTLRDLERGMLDTAASDHPDGSPVRLFAFEVSENEEYPELGFLALEDEWIGPVEKAEHGGRAFFTGLVLNGATVLADIQRGIAGTTAAAHDADVKCIPIFYTQDPACGREDMVTLAVGDHSTAEEALVRRAHTFGDPDDDEPDDYAVALDDFTLEEYGVDTASRVLKFPTGKLPEVFPGAVTVGADSMGAPALRGRIDEVRLDTLTRGDYELTEALDESGDPSINNPAALPGPAGAILVGDEIIGFRVQGDAIEWTRGWLGTQAVPHDLGDPYMQMTTLDVASLTEGVGPSDARIPVAGTGGFPPVGMVEIGDEWIFYDAMDSDAFRMSPDRNSGQVMTRGAFGTDPQSHDTSELVYGMPCRRWVGWKPGARTPRAVHFQAAHFAPGARWLRLRWAEELVHDDLDLQVFVRFDGEPDWGRVGAETMVTATRPGRDLELDRIADVMEVRVCWDHTADTHESHAWKTAPILRHIEVEYLRPEIVHLHETLEE